MIDTRILIVLVPILVAASWAVLNAGRLLLQQVLRM